jgi:hypothetical protein
MLDKIKRESGKIRTESQVQDAQVQTMIIAHITVFQPDVQFDLLLCVKTI